MNLRRRRRGVLLFALRGIRLLRQHYLTLFSATVLAAFAILALKSDAFQSSSRVPALPALLQNPPRGEVIGSQYLQSILWSPPQADLGLRSVVYYVYESEMQREVLEAGLRDLARARFKLDDGGPEDTNLFLRAATPEEAAAAADQLARAETLARAQGYRFEIVDLRSSVYD